jgi:hypothetical protein
MKGIGGAALRDKGRSCVPRCEAARSSASSDRGLARAASIVLEDAQS